jgi:hypothetical protein
MPTLQSATPVPRTVDDTLRRAELFHFLTEETDLLIYDYDVNSGRIAWQGPIAQVLGYPPEQFARMDVARWIASIHPEDRAATVKAHEQALADGGRFSLAYRFQHRAGHYVPIHDRGVALLGAAPRLVGSIFDASEGPPPGLLPRMLLARTAAVTGLDFLQTLVREGGLLLGGQRVGIARKLPGQSDTLHTVAAWQRDGLNPPAEFPIRNSPARLALEQGYFETSGNLAAYFPQWAALDREGTIASYAGVALKTTAGQTLGLFWIMFGPEAKPPPSLAAIMRLFAVRASAELERLLLEQGTRDQPRPLPPGHRWSAGGRPGGQGRPGAVRQSRGHETARLCRARGVVAHAHLGAHPVWRPRRVGRNHPPVRRAADRTLRPRNHLATPRWQRVRSRSGRRPRRFRGAAGPAIRPARHHGAPPARTRLRSRAPRHRGRLRRGVLPVAGEANWDPSWTDAACSWAGWSIRKPC